MSSLSRNKYLLPFFYALFGPLHRFLSGPMRLMQHSIAWMICCPPLLSCLMQSPASSLWSNNFNSFHIKTIFDGVDLLVRHIFWLHWFPKDIYLSMELNSNHLAFCVSLWVTLVQLSSAVKKSSQEGKSEFGECPHMCGCPKPSILELMSALGGVCP